MCIAPQAHEPENLLLSIGASVQPHHLLLQQRLRTSVDPLLFPTLLPQQPTSERSVAVLREDHRGDLVPTKFLRNAEDEVLSPDLLDADAAPKALQLRHRRQHIISTDVLLICALPSPLPPLAPQVLQQVRERDHAPIQWPRRNADLGDLHRQLVVEVPEAEILRPEALLGVQRVHADARTHRVEVPPELRVRADLRLVLLSEARQTLFKRVK
mmetsp:Transcript_5127/g.20493  ORF Transcript_5127/g.20493 Transcript_5127/m.20493 type:complete len:213 (-) Transcript_5127:222-860(-)